MDTDLQTLQDTFKFGYETFEQSRIEEREVTNMFHNRQFTEEQLNTLELRGQPAETFNVIKLFARLMVGYYSTVVNNVSVEPRRQSDEATAGLLADVINYTFEDNMFETEGDKIKLDGILSGLMCCFETVVDTGERDRYGRSIKRISLSHVPSREIILDPMSRAPDGSDARFIHRFKWVSKDYLVKMLKNQGYGPDKIDSIIDSMNAYENHVNQADTEFDVMYNDQFTGYYRQFDNYLLIHSVIVDEDDKAHSVYWCGETEISRKEVTYREVRFPYRVQKLNDSDKAEYYGMFREVIESQKAINQAIIKIQTMVNSQKVLIQEGSVKSLDEFTNSYNNTNAIISVLKLTGIQVENLSAGVVDQYNIIDKAFDRIQRVLGVNDSFLGFAFASDSGRKVKLQQNATVIQLRHLTILIQQFYRSVAWDVANLAKQFYTANEMLRMTDEPTGARWAELNKPMQVPTGERDASGEPIYETPMEEVLDPESGEPMMDDNGNYIIAPVPEHGTELAFSKVTISIDTIAYNDQDETNQLFTESVMQGTMGQALLQFDPSVYFTAVGLNMQGMRTKDSPRISKAVLALAERLAQQPVEQNQAIAAGVGHEGGQPRSGSGLKLDANTKGE